MYHRFYFNTLLYNVRVHCNDQQDLYNLYGVLYALDELFPYGQCTRDDPGLQARHIRFCE